MISSSNNHHHHHHSFDSDHFNNHHSSLTSDATLLPSLTPTPPVITTTSALDSTTTTSGIPGFKVPPILISINKANKSSGNLVVDSHGDTDKGSKSQPTTPRKSATSGKYSPLSLISPRKKNKNKDKQQHLMDQDPQISPILKSTMEDNSITASISSERSPVLTPSSFDNHSNSSGIRHGQLSNLQSANNSNTNSNNNSAFSSSRCSSSGDISTEYQYQLLPTNDEEDDDENDDGAHSDIEHHDEEDQHNLASHSSRQSISSNSSNHSRSSSRHSSDSHVSSSGSNNNNNNESFEQQKEIIELEEKNAPITPAVSNLTTPNPPPNSPIDAAKKKPFFSFFSRKPKQNAPIVIPEKPTQPLSNLSTSQHTTPNIIGAKLTVSTPSTTSFVPPYPSMVPMTSISRSYDSIKTMPSISSNNSVASPIPVHYPMSFAVSSSITPNIISPAPSPALKTSILHNKPRGQSLSNLGGKKEYYLPFNHQQQQMNNINNNNTPNITQSNSMIHPSFTPISSMTPSVNSPNLSSLLANSGSGYVMLTNATDATWVSILTNWEEWSEPHFRPLLTKYIYQGIPDRFRATMWFHLSNLIPQLTPIPTCPDLQIKYNSVEKLPNFTPLSTPSTITPNGTPTIRSQSASSIFLPSNLIQSITTSGGIQINNNNQNNTSPSNTSPLSQSSPGSGTSKLHHHKCFYSSILKHNSEHEEQIDVDIQRTFPDIPQDIRDNYATSLSNVLKAISLYDREMGYCQGLSFVGSILITKIPEEETFHILLRLLEGVMRDFYIVGMRGLKLRLYQLSKLVKELFPKLHSHLENIDLDYTIFASPWFLTAFSYHLSEECTYRIMDVILLQGVEAYFSIGLAIFQIIESDLLACQDSSAVMEFFRCNAKDRIEVGLLMDTASRIGVSAPQLAQFGASFESNEKPTVPTEFNPDATPKEKMRDPNWVVKKYKLKERISNLEQDLALIKLELHNSNKKSEEEKIELVKHVHVLSDRETSLLEQKRAADINYQALLKENEELKKKLQQSEECNNFLADEMRVLRSKMDHEIWNKNNPKKSIQFYK